MQKWRVNPCSYSLDREQDDADCLLFEAGRWLVFYSERNQRVEPQAFASEADALDLLHDRLVRYRQG